MPFSFFDLFGDFGFDTKRVTEKHRLDEFPFSNGCKRDRLHTRAIAAQSSHPGNSQKTVSDRLSEVRRLRVLVIDMQRIEVSGERREIHDVGFGNRSAGTGPSLPQFDILVVQRFRHRVIRP